MDVEMEWAPILLSFKIAGAATAIALVLGVALGALLAWPKMRARDFVDAVVCAPMVLPPTVLGYYLLVALGKESAVGRAWHAVFGSDIVFTFTGAVVAAVVGSLPFVVKASRIAFEQVDPTLQQAARTLGAGPVRIFFTITLPLSARGISAGAALGFAHALGNFGITLMLIGLRIGDTSPAAIYIYDQLNAGHDVVARNASIAMTIVAVGTMYLVNRYLAGRRSA
jgi:molybdate transport system permease protein